MSGHSKWSTIKRKKAAMDAKRGALFTKLAREIQVAAREGPDPEKNFKLRLAIEKAKAHSMPKENIERAIRRGSGLEKGGEELEEIIYEGYGPHGVAIIVEALTDNRNRAVADIRRVFTRAGGSLGESGSVAWQFEMKGYITVPMASQDEDAVLEAAIEAGAEDVEFSDDVAEVYTAPTDLQAVREAFQERGIPVENAELIWKPTSTVSLGRKETLQNLSLIEALEDLDDVSRVFSNLDISEEAVEEFAAA
ncbi:MAG TPA: YebC/PmpR family DNA-binding transcriptional regulator [Caldilineae bacterium]|nr:YebC/PmpR family DNA-binding transcriptional regulator [Caldilineae bacterium]